MAQTLGINFEITRVVKLFFSIFILFSTLTVSAADFCRDVLEIDNFTEWLSKSNQAMKAALVGNPAKGDKEIYIYWHIANPFRLVKVGNKQYQSVMTGNRMRLYQNNPDESKTNPLKTTNTLFAKQDTSNRTLLDSTLDNYEDRLSEEHIEAIKVTEEDILRVAEDRESYGYVAEDLLEHGGETAGTMRVYNGSVAHSHTPAFLAMEYSFFNDKVVTKISKKLAKIRLENPKQLIFEIGKFSLNKLATIKGRARAILELFLLHFYIHALPADTLYYAHVGSESRAKLFHDRYGFKLFETVEIPNGTPEYVLEATGAELTEAFFKLYPMIPKPNFRILSL